MASYLMGAGLVTISLLYWLFKTITDWSLGSNVSGSRGPFRLAASHTLGALFGGAIASALSLGVALFVLLVRDGNSYYEQVMAENATYIAFYILIILGIYFPLSSFKGPEFATTWMSLYYLLVWIQLISLFAVIYDAINNYETIQFGNQPSLQAQLGGSPANNPVVYSILFLMVGGISRIFLIFSFTFKALGKWFNLYASWKTEPSDNALSKNQRRKNRIRQVFADAESLSLLIAVPLFIVGIFVIGSLLILYFILSLFFNRPLDGKRLGELRRQYYEEIPRLMEWCFGKASYGAWFLSFLHSPYCGSTLHSF
jgi:hypothetical protein